MRESDLLCHIKRKWVKTTDSRHYFPRYPNLIKGMVIDRLNQVWVTDITYIRIKTGFVYLAAILDACSRRVTGYAVSTGLDTTLTLEALRMAIAERKPSPSVIYHSDRGVQYASGEYVDELKRHGFEISMARTGNPYENARMESFFKIKLTPPLGSASTHPQTLLTKLTIPVLKEHKSSLTLNS